MLTQTINGYVILGECKIDPNDLFDFEGSLKIANLDPEEHPVVQPCVVLQCCEANKKSLCVGDVAYVIKKFGFLMAIEGHRFTIIHEDHILSRLPKADADTLGIESRDAVKPKANPLLIPKKEALKTVREIFAGAR